MFKETLRTLRLRQRGSGFAAFLIPELSGFARRSGLTASAALLRSDAHVRSADPQRLRGGSLCECIEFA